MALSRDSRQVSQLKAIRMAQHRLRQRLETIDFVEDKLNPEVEALKAGKPILGLTAGQAFDIQLVAEESKESQ